MCVLCAVYLNIYIMCVCIHICTCIWSAAVKIRYLSEALPTLSFETGSCTEPGLTYWLTALVTNLSDTQCHVSLQHALWLQTPTTVTSFITWVLEI